jgi:hypothetical protein
VSVRNFVIPFYYGSSSGSALAKSYGSSSATLVVVRFFCVCMKLPISIQHPFCHENFSYSLFRGADLPTLWPRVWHGAAVPQAPSQTHMQTGAHTLKMCGLPTGVCKRRRADGSQEHLSCPDSIAAGALWLLWLHRGLERPVLPASGRIFLPV